MEARESNEKKKERLAKHRRLKEGLRSRTRSLEEMKTVGDYVQAIYDEDRTLEVDRGILATIVVWGPILALLIALAVSPQGKDLLDQFVSDASARSWLLFMIGLLNVVATTFSTNLIAGWFFPRVARAAKENFLFWPQIPKDLVSLNQQERWVVFRWSVFPVVATIALPLAFLAEAAFGWAGWWSTFIFISWLFIHSALAVGTVFVCTHLVIRTLSASGPAALLGVLCLFVLTIAPVWCTFRLTTPVVVVAAAISWLLVIHKFTFVAFISRYEATGARVWANETEWRRFNFFAQQAYQRCSYGTPP